MTTTQDIATRLGPAATVAAIYEAFGRGDVPAILEEMYENGRARWLETA